MKRRSNKKVRLKEEPLTRLERNIVGETKLPAIAKDADGKLYWVQHWHVMPSGITVEQLTRKAIKDYNKRKDDQMLSNNHLTLEEIKFILQHYAEGGEKIMQGIIRNLVMWSTSDECWVNANDLDCVPITAPHLVEAYNDTFLQMCRYLDDKQVSRLRGLIRENIEIRMKNEHKR